MAYMDEFLFRRSLKDTGNLLDAGSYCASPDIIKHEMVASPQVFFRDNYMEDPCDPLCTGRLINPVYTRIKSMQTEDGPRTGYIRLYRVGAALFMNTNQWQNHKLMTAKGRSYVTIHTTSQGEIAVGDDYFIASGVDTGYCLIGIVNTTLEETLPQNFTSFDDFVDWAYERPAIAIRYLRLNYTEYKNDCELLCAIVNPEINSRFGALCLNANKLPAGTVFGFDCLPLSIDESKTFDPDNPQSKEISAAITLPAGFDGQVRMFGRLSAGQSWPKDAEMEMTFYIDASTHERMHAFGHKPEDIITVGSSRAPFTRANRLVNIGVCRL